MAISGNDLLNDSYIKTINDITTNTATATKINDLLDYNNFNYNHYDGLVSKGVACDPNSNICTNKTEKRKENDKMKGFNFDFGPVKDVVHMSMYGMAIKNKNGTYVSYDKASDNLIDVDILNFAGANKFMFKMPVPIKDIRVGDIIVHNGVPCFVKGLRNNMVHTFMVIDPYEAEQKEILIPKSMFGFDYVTKVVNLMDGMFGNATASADQPFGNMLPLMLMSDSKDIDPMMLMMMMGQSNGMDFAANPMMLYVLMSGNKDIDPMMLFALSGAMNPTHPQHECTCDKVATKADH